MGHATRSQPIIEHLKKRHKVRIFAGGKALPYLRRYFSVHWLASTHLVYRDNAVHDVRSVLLNIVRSPLYAVSFISLLCVMLFRRPDVLITDFEPWSAWAAMLTGVPVVSIALPACESREASTFPQRHRGSHRKMHAVARAFIPRADAVVMPSFFVPAGMDARVQPVKPVIRAELASRTPTSGAHVLVYQTSSSNQRLLNALKSFPRQQFVIYGFPRDDRDANLRFKRFNEKEFFDDLASAKAVIANGGLSLLCEALYFRKPVLSIPVAGQCEQIINAHYLEKLGYGMTAREATPAVLKRFFSQLQRQREALKKPVASNLPSVFTTIDKVLNDVAQ